MTDYVKELLAINPSYDPDLLEKAFSAKSDVRSIIEVKAFGCSGRIEGGECGVPCTFPARSGKEEA